MRARLAGRTRRHMLWGAVSRAVRAADAHRHGPPVYPAAPGRPRRGDPDFESEEVVAYEPGYRVPAAAPRLSLDLAAFYNVYDDLRSQELRRAAAVRSRQSAERRRRGVELRANVQAAAGWRLYASYAYLEGLQLDPGSTDPTGGVFGGQRSEHRSRRCAPRWTCRTAGARRLLRYVDELPQPGGAAYTELDLRLGWRSRRLELSLVGQNLLHDQPPGIQLHPPTIRVRARRLPAVHMGF